MFDFSNASTQGNGALIPKNTFARLIMNVRPGGAGDGGFLRRTKAGNGLMLDCEFTVVEGEHARRKFWGLFTVEGETEGQQKAIEISRSTLRAILESARGVKPSDASPEAAKARQVNSWDDFDGIEFIGLIGVEESKDPQYADKNKLVAVITPDRKEYAQFKPGGGMDSVPFFQKGGSAPSKPTSSKPAWGR